MIKPFKSNLVHALQSFFFFFFFKYIVMAHNSKIIKMVEIFLDLTVCLNQQSITAITAITYPRNEQKA